MDAAAAATGVIFHVAFLKQIPQRDENKKPNNNNNNEFLPSAGVSNAATAAAEIFILRGRRGRKKLIINAKQPHSNKTSLPGESFIQRRMTCGIMVELYSQKMLTLYMYVCGLNLIVRLFSI